MARIEQSIEVNAPVHAAYAQLVQFEEYPRFMDGVHAVRQTDATHLHWLANRADGALEWDAEITEQRAGECVAWHNLNGPQSAARVELQPVGEEKSRVVFTMECDASQTAAAQRLEQDLVRFKLLIENRGAATGWSAEQTAGVQANASTQSDYALSRGTLDAAEAGQFGVAEEQNFDMQSEQARRVGRMPQDDAGPAAMRPSDAMAKSLKQGRPGPKG